MTTTAPINPNANTMAIITLDAVVRPSSCDEPTIFDSKEVVSYKDCAIELYYHILLYILVNNGKKFITQKYSILDTKLILAKAKRSNSYLSTSSSHKLQLNQL